MVWQLSPPVTMQAAPHAAADMDADETDGVWSKDIEDAFEEALQIYPPCGRRKIVLSEEGRMYGRNELIAMHIYQKTGKHRTRKQVSSHIQVLARKKQREAKQQMLDAPQGAQVFNGLSSAEIVTQSVTGVSINGQGGMGAMSKGMLRLGGQGAETARRMIMSQFMAYIEYQNSTMHRFVNLNGHHHFENPAIETIDILQIWDKFPDLRALYANGPKNAFFLVKFWADLHYDKRVHAGGPESGFFGIDSAYRSNERMKIECSTSVISLQQQVVEKIQAEEGVAEDGCYVYRFKSSPMCPYMISFIEKLHNLENPEFMNRVLENFSVVQVLRDTKTQKVLLCTAYLFEISMKGFGTRHQVYRLYEDGSATDSRRFTT